jgi:hypothetical protein
LLPNGRGESSTTPAQLATIPLNLIQPHPKLAFRFAYDVASLAESLSSTADENTPNGQLNPGRVVLRPDGQGYYVYIGVRRYHALKQLYETTKKEKFGFYTAYIDTGMTELQMFVRAKKENDEEKGERQGLSVLEELFGITMIRGTINPEGLDKWLRRLVDVADKLDERRFRKLYEIEVACRFKFRLPHLEYLCGIESEEDFFLTAATAAGFGYTGDEMRIAWEDRKAAYHLDWFSGILPGLAFGQAEDISSRGDLQAEGNVVSLGTPVEGPTPEAKHEGLEIHEKNVIVVPCPRCGMVYKVGTKGAIEATHIPPDPEKEWRTEVAVSVSRLQCTCAGCNRKCFMFVKQVGEGVYAVELSRSMKFREPHKKVEAVELRFDYVENVWQTIGEGSLAGALPQGAGKE